MNIQDGNKLIQDWLSDNKTHYPIDKLKFHSSWDWLMPVVEKISSIGGAMAAQTIVAVKANILNIKNAHKSVVNFIQWYNQNKIIHD